MFEIKEALNGNATLTVIDNRGTVILHETVKASEAEDIAAHVLLTVN